MTDNHYYHSIVIERYCDDAGFSLTDLERRFFAEGDSLADQPVDSFEDLDELPDAA